MDVRIERDDAIKIVSIDGRLDVAGSDQARDEIIKLIDGKPMIISMAKCPYVSSSGLRAMVVISKTAKAKKTRLIYAAATAEVMDVLEMTGFKRMLQFAATTTEAESELMG